MAIAIVVGGKNVILEKNVKIDTHERKKKLKKPTTRTRIFELNLLSFSKFDFA